MFNPKRKQRTMKTMNMFKNVAAAVLLVAGMTACSQDNELIAPQAPESKTVTQTIQVTFGGNNDITRTVDANGHKSVAVGEKISVLYNVKNYTFQKRVEANIDAYDEATKTATISVTLYEPDENAQYAFVYPADLHIYSGWYRAPGSEDLMINAFATEQDPRRGMERDQDGTLNGTYGVNRFDYCKAEGTLDGTSLPTTLTMTNQLSIMKFTLQDASDNSDITSKVTNFIVSYGADRDYNLSLDGAAAPVYMVMWPVSNKTITFVAQTATDIYRKTVSGVTLEAGKIYTSTLKLTKQVNNVGKILGANGNIYATVAEAEAAGTTASGMIAYEGEETGVDGKTNSLCISLHDGSAVKVAKEDISFAGFPERPAGASDWALPTPKQWEHMLFACGGSPVKSNSSYTGLFNSGKMQTFMTACGGDAFHAADDTDGYLDTYYQKTYQDNYGVYRFNAAYNLGSTPTNSNWYRGIFAW